MGKNLSNYSFFNMWKEENILIFEKRKSFKMWKKKKKRTFVVVYYFYYLYSNNLCVHYYYFNCFMNFTLRSNVYVIYLTLVSFCVVSFVLSIIHPSIVPFLEILHSHIIFPSFCPCSFQSKWCHLSRVKWFHSFPRLHLGYYDLNEGERMTAQSLPKRVDVFDEKGMWRVNSKPGLHFW